MSNGKGNRGGSNPTRDYGNMVHQEVQKNLAEWLKQERDSRYDDDVFADHCAILGIGDDKDEGESLYEAEDQRFYDLPWLPAPSPFD